MFSEVETGFDPELPFVPRHAGEFNQVILNLLINAARAIRQVVGDGSGGKGKIAITTKPVGRNRSRSRLAHTIIVRKHGGRIWFESVLGKGTTFFNRLPVSPLATES